MEPSRSSRFRRLKQPGSFCLTARDRSILELHARYRFLRSSDIFRLLAENQQTVLRRLQLLYHQGYLERPRAQLDYYHLSGSRPIVYGLGKKGAELLRNELGIPVRDVNWGEKNRSVGRIFLEHALLISEIMVAFELACRANPNIRLIDQHELFPPTKPKTKEESFRWKASLSNNLSLGVIPDHVFALEYQSGKGGMERAYFFLEADRGTMPVKRANLVQTSMYRKFLAYEATWHRGIHRARFGFHRFRVLTVTKNAERLNSLLETCSQLKTGHGLFLFADRSTITKPEDVFGPIWHSPKQGASRFLLG